jgi:hypothetical protein
LLVLKQYNVDKEILSSYVAIYVTRQSNLQHQRQEELQQEILDVIDVQEDEIYGDIYALLMGEDNDEEN